MRKAFTILMVAWLDGIFTADKPQTGYNEIYVKNVDLCPCNDDVFNVSSLTMRKVTKNGKSPKSPFIFAYCFVSV